MSECSHCNGTRVCQDSYHEDYNLRDQALTFMGCKCDTCGGGSGDPRDCPYCKGSGESDDD